MRTLGIDPDLHTLAYAEWEDGPRSAGIITVSRKLKQQDAVVQMVDALAMHLEPDRHDITRVAVEAQTLQRTGPRQHKRPQDIVVLGNVAGAVLGVLAARGFVARLRFPTPEEWKGQIPKEVMQARLYDELGWGYIQKSTYSVPLRIPQGFKHVAEGAWKHVGDALLLARWVATL